MLTVTKEHAAYINVQHFVILQVTRIALRSTNLVKEETVCTQSNPTTCLPLMCFVTKQQPVGGGQCSRGE